MSYCPRQFTTLPTRVQLTKTGRAARYGWYPPLAMTPASMAFCWAPQQSSFDRQHPASSPVMVTAATRRHAEILIFLMVAMICAPAWVVVRSGAVLVALLRPGTLIATVRHMQGLPA